MQTRKHINGSVLGLNFYENEDAYLTMINLRIWGDDTFMDVETIKIENHVKMTI